MTILRWLILVLSGYLLVCDTVAEAAPVPTLQQQAARLQNQIGGTEREQKIRRILAMRLMKIHEGADVDHQDKRGQTALMLAAAINHADLITSLLLRGADPIIRTRKGKCAHDFCTDSALISLLLHCSRPAAGGITLHQAVCLPGAAATRTALQLLRAGADVNEPDSSGRTPIMLISAGQEELATLLMTAGARQEDWCARERRTAKVSYIDVFFTHQGASAEELEREDIANAQALDQLAREQVSWRYFRDKALRRQNRRTCPMAYQWSRRKKQHTHYNYIWKQEYLRDPEQADGISGYLGHVQRGTLTLHYPDNIPPLRYQIQAGGRARHFHGTGDSTSPVVPEGLTARLYTDLFGHTIKGFFISCLGRSAIPQFSDTRSDIMLHLATVAVPGETEESTIRHNGSHGCISVLSLRDWEIISSELRKNGGAGADGVEIRIRYAGK